jgi:hypothetical protein
MTLMKLPRALGATLLLVVGCTPPPSREGPRLPDDGVSVAAAIDLRPPSEPVRCDDLKRAMPLLFEQLPFCRDDGAQSTAAKLWADDGSNLRVRRADFAPCWGICSGPMKRGRIERRTKLTHGYCFDGWLTRPKRNVFDTFRPDR